MQKLIRLVKNQKGSTLVGAVVICTILGIGIAGLIGATRNTVSQEHDMHDDARVFLAAESGLHVLTRWIMRAGTDAAATPSRTGNITVDGIDVFLEMRSAGAGFPNDHWRLMSTATVDGLPYSKTVEWIIQWVPGRRVRPPSRYGAIMSSNAMAGGMQNEHFDGPVHFNAPLRINNDMGNRPTFRGPVSIHDPDGSLVGGYGVGNNGNDFYKGVWIPTANDHNQVVSRLNAIFQNTYNSDAPYLGVKILPPADFARKNLTDIAPLRTGGVANTLDFSVSGTGDAAIPSITFNDVPWPYNRGTEYVFHVDGPLRVSHGTMLGKVTVETSAGNNITIDLTGGSLTYQWAASSISATTDGIAYDNITKRPNGEYYEDVLAFYSGSDVLMGNNNNVFRALTAQLFAVENDNGTIDFGTTNQKEITLFGTAGMNKYWRTTQNQGNTLFTGIISEIREPSAPAIILVDREGNRIIDGDELEEEDIPDVLERMLWVECNRTSAGNYPGPCPPRI